MSENEDHGLEIPGFELIRRIGRGAYGEVWIGRSATGAYRAVKVIRKESFQDDARPFEREFEGLKRFEAVSQRHENLLNVLYVGREQGWLYYVMELADDFMAQGTEGNAPGFDPATYQADTLQRRIERLGRLSFVECLEISWQLATALECLHQSGLVHRDVKPGNIVFVRGVAKLADVGLVAHMDDTLSIVGTEGYIPPEGPGTAQADVYALGKILYEISTGRDRKDFPALGEPFIQASDRRPWLEMNEVVLKAAEAHPEKRYRSAQALAEDVERLKKGVSLMQRRRWRKVARVMRVALLGIGLVVALAWGGGALERWRSGARETVTRSWNPTLVPLGGFSLAMSTEPTSDRRWDASPDGRWLVVERSDGMLLWNRESQTGRLLLEDHSEGWRFRWPRWSADHRRLVVVAHRTRDVEGAKRPESRVVLIDTASGEIVQTLCQAECPIGGLAVSRKLKAVAFMERLPSRSRLSSIAISGAGERLMWEGLEGFEQPALGDFSPDGRWLAFSAKRERDGDNLGRDVFVMPMGGGTAVQVTDRDGIDIQPTWSSDGTQLCYVSGDEQWMNPSWNLWSCRVDPATGQRVEEAIPLTRYEDTKVVQPAYIAASSEWMFGLVRRTDHIHHASTEDGEGGSRVAAGRSPLLSADGHWLYYVDPGTSRGGIYRLSPQGEGSPERMVDARVQNFDLSPDGAAIVYSVRQSQGLRGIFLYDLNDRVSLLLAELTTASSWVEPKWSPDGNRVAWIEEGRLFVVGRSGEPARMLGEVGARGGDPPAWSPSGRELAIIGSRKEPRGEIHYPIYVTDTETGELRTVAPNLDAGYKEGLCWHPSGDWFTFTHFLPLQGSDIKRVFADGSRNDTMIESTDRWEWVGRWHPDGNRFFFMSSLLEGEDPDGSVLVYDLETEDTRHASAMGWMSWSPSWSLDGQQIIWSQYSTTSQLCVVREGVPGNR